MRADEFPNGEHVLRAKIDMSASNIVMRDPIMYRIKREPHFRTHNAPPADGRKIPGVIHWVAANHAVPAEVRLYDRLFWVPEPKDENYKGLYASCQD